MGNSEITRTGILDAALAEFAAHGVAGARVDRIAAAAGCNKNLIYVYFQSKENLFATVLEQQLPRVYREIPFTPDDLAGYAARVFDFAMDNPALMRLLAWNGLEGRAAPQPVRTRARDEKVRELATGTAEAGFAPEFLLTAVMALATAWAEPSPYGPGLDPDGGTDRDALRATVHRAVAVLAGAPPAG